MVRQIDRRRCRCRLLAPLSGLLALALVQWAVVGCGRDDARPAARRQAPAAGASTAGWPTWGGDPGGQRYSPLSEIHRHNVHALEVAWVYRTGDWPAADDPHPKFAFQATPILDGDTLYLCSPSNRIHALDAETGRAHWVYDASPRIESKWARTCRGVALWRGGGAGPCARRVFMGTLDARLVAVDAATGEPCRDFGDGGSVDLRRGLGDVQPGEYYVTSAPTVLRDVVAVGALVADNRRVDGPGGVIRAFDVRSGALRWAFDPVPPGTPRLAPGPDGEPRWHRGTPNAWSVFAADVERNLLFVPFGGPSPDFFGGLRRGFDHYGSSVVALDGASGRPRWRFQTVHHDLWDYDVASQPTLVEWPSGSAAVPAVVQATKLGHLFVLDRDTGEPLFPVVERPVPQSDVPGEASAPTQPYPTHPPALHPDRLEPEEAFGFTPWDRAVCRARIAATRNEGVFTPPSLRGSLQYPGTAGGANWGGVAIDPERRLLVLNQSRVAQVHTLIPREEFVPPAGERRRRGHATMVQAGAPYAVRQEVLLSPLGAPCVPPPWGTLSAVDLETGEKRWEVPFGGVRDMLPFPVGLLASQLFDLELGMPSMGGPIVTAGGLVFIAASMDDYLRAFDSETGALLWRARLPAGGQATPMTYRLQPDGRQYVVIAAGGHSTLGTRPGDWLIAYALPETARGTEALSR